MVLALSFSAVAVRGADILFISAMDEAVDPGGADDILKVFMEGLGHTVTMFDDGESEADTEIAAAAADMVFISESVGSGEIRTEITEIETPMVITECWGWDEMGLTLGDGAGQDVVTTDIEIVAPEHHLAAGLSGTISVLTDISGDLGTARFGNGMAGNEATVIATATLTDGQTWDVIYVYEKGATLPVPPADGSPREAADIRVCLGFDERSYLVWNENAYLLLEAAINFALGIRPQPESYSPNPANGKTEVPQYVVLGWRAGIYADTHNVYFGTDFDDVNQASITDPRGVLIGENLSVTTYELPELLEFGQTYYWRVDEVNAPPDSAIYRGEVWSFTVLDFLVVEDFEGYTDYVPNDIFTTWKDGYGTDDNGALIGYDSPDIDAGEHFVETEIVNNGEQSLPYVYNNDAKYSEAWRQLDSIRDWTSEGVVDLSLWFRGNPPYTGSFVEDPVGTYTMTGSGADIWDNADQFHFAFKEVTGTANIIAKVESVENTHEFAKAGVMIRDSLDADSANTALLVTPENGVRFQYRNTADGSTDRQFTEGITAPYWVRLERTSGGLVRAYYSPDGNAWERFNLTQITMSSPMYIGLAVTSHDAELTCEAVFSNVSFPDTNVDILQWTDQDIGMLSNDAAPMYVALSNTTGDPAAVYHDDPNVTQIDTWTEWVIPLQEFVDKGVDLTDVDKIAIGFGDKDNPQQNSGAGTMYFDDIRLYLPKPPEPPQGITVENFSFELPGTEKIKGWNGEGVADTPADDVPGWSSDTVVADSGVETGYTPTDGEWTAFLMSGDPSVWQLTDYTISDGDVLELKVDARITWAATAMQMTLYYDDNGARVPASTEQVNLTDDMQEYTLSLSAADVPEAVGKKVGIEFSNASTGDTWIGMDNVRLEVSSE
jgi:hypothetical protein